MTDFPAGSSLKSTASTKKEYIIGGATQAFALVAPGSIPGVIVFMVSCMRAFENQFRARDSVYDRIVAIRTWTDRLTVPACVHVAIMYVFVGDEDKRIRWELLVSL